MALYATPTTFSKVKDAGTLLLLSPLCSAQAAAPTKRSTVVRMAHVSTGGEAGNVSSAFEEGHLERPPYIGETPLSRLVGALISFKPLYSLMKLGARQVFIG